MPVSMTCPNPACSKVSVAPDEFVGKTVRCKNCGRSFVAQATIDQQSRDTQQNSTETSVPFPKLPAEFGRYRVLKLLGKGGMGSVYLAEDTQLRRQLALKIPSFDAATSPQRVERFVREARSAAVLQHPNICTVYDAGQINGLPFITMAYINGQPLEGLIDPEKPLTQKEAARIARQIALALQDAHEQGIVHRDLKPVNVMLNQKGEPFVMDFGLAKKVADVEADEKEAKLTRDGAVMGTPSYMAPEQVRGEVDRIGPPTDVYALGVMLFEMLTGRTPYRGNIGMIMGQILGAPVPPLSEFRADIDPRLNAICQRAMAKEAKDRFPNMSAMAEALSTYLEPSTVSVEMLPKPESAFADLTEDTEPRPKAATKTKPEQKPGSNKVLLIGLAVGLLALFGLAVVAGGVWFTLRTKYGEVVIELSDPTAKVDINVDGERIELNTSGKAYSFKAGEHGLTVAGDGFETVTQKFSVKSGQKEVVRVSLKPKAKSIEVAKGYMPKQVAPPEPISPAPKSADPKPPTEPNPALPIASDGFTPLFNGKDLTGWRGLPQLWSVQGGTIVGSSQPNGLKFNTCLCADGEYGDFELSLQLKISDGANSGVQIRSKLFDADKLIFEGPQCDAGTTFWGSLYGERAGGMMQAADAAAVAQALKPNEFNELFVLCIGNRVTIKLNGITTVDREFDNLPAKGLIGLQLHGGLGQKVEFRNLQIKHLSAKPNASAPAAPEFTPLFNGKDLTGWKSYGKPIWEWKDGRLVGQSSTDRTAGILLTDASYTDLELELEYKSNPGLGSGLFLRADPDANISGAQHLEVQICDDVQFATTPFKTGAVFGAFARKADPTIKAGDWNKMRVKLLGRKLEVWVNGTQTVDANLDDARAQFGKVPGLARTSGKIGLQQNQRVDVEFRNIQIQDFSGTKPTDPFQVNSVWVSAGTTLQVLTVIERKGETFRARFKVGGGAGIDREVSGTVKNGKVTWLAKDVKAVRGSPGGDNTGTFATDGNGDRLDFTWIGPGAARGAYILRRQVGQ